MLDRNFFVKYQRYLVWFANTRFGRRFLKIHKDCPKDKKIIQIEPHCYTWDEGIKWDEKTKTYWHYKTTDFRSNAKFALRINRLFMWLPFNAYRLEKWDWKKGILLPQPGEWVLQPKFGLTVSTFYPDANVETSSVDGYVTHFNGDGLSWTNLRNAAGTNVGSSQTVMYVTARCDANTDKWDYIDRMIILFDTSSLPDEDTIDSATLSLYSYSKVDESSDNPNINIYSSDPNSDTDLIPSDYTSLGTTPFSTAITYTNWKIDFEGYNDFALNASGLAAISKTGASKFGARNANYDVANVAPTWSSGKKFQLCCRTADNTGTDFDPKLVVTHSAPITLDLSETISINSSLIKQAGILLSEATTIADSVKWQTSRIFNEVINITEILQKHITKIFSEATTIVDSFKGRAEKKLSEAIVLADALQKKTTRIFMEIVQVAASLKNMTVKIFNEVIQIADDLKNEIVLLLSEAMQITDSILRNVGKIFGEAVVVVSVLKNKTIKVFNEAIQILDSLKNKAIKFLSEAIQATDSLLSDIGKVLNEPITIVDTLENNLTRIFSEAIQITATLKNQAILIFNNTIAITDSFKGQAKKLLSEAIAIADTVQSGISRVFNEVIAIAGILTNKAIKIFSEVIEITDSILRNISKVLNETITIIDSVKNRVARIFNEIVGVVDILIKKAIKIFSETAQITDSILKTAGRTFSEAVTLAQDFLTLHTTYQTCSEIITIVQSLTNKTFKVLKETVSLVGRLFGLLNGVNMRYSKKYTDKIGNYIKKYFDI